MKYQRSVLEVQGQVHRPERVNRCTCPYDPIITTNLTPQQIRGHYGDRIADRLNEMVKKIVFNNCTYRTDKFATRG